MRDVYELAGESIFTCLGGDVADSDLRGGVGDEGRLSRRVWEDRNE